MSPILDRLFKACEGSGYQILHADKQAIEKSVEGMTDDTLNKAVSAFASQLPSGGIKNVEFNGIRQALVASEPQLDAIANEKIDQLYTALEQALLNAANGSK